MTKKVLSAIVAIAMVFQGVAAFAAAGSSTVEDYTSDMSNTLTSGDSTTDPLSIGVNASVVANGPVYKIDVSWGDMSFKFDAPSNAWDPETHTYNSSTGTGTGGGQWTAAGVNGTNNKITITNDSAYAIGASFDYKEDPTNKLNADPNDPNKVVPLFRLDNSELDPMRTVLNNTAVNGTNNAAVAPLSTGGLTSANPYYDPAMTNSKTTLYLPTADFYNPDGGPSNGYVNGARTCNVFFGFAGTPDNIAFQDKQVGSINIDFYPCDNDEINNTTSFTDGTAAPVFHPTDGKWSWN